MVPAILAVCGALGEGNAVPQSVALAIGDGAARFWTGDMVSARVANSRLLTPAFHVAALCGLGIGGAGLRLMLRLAPREAPACLGA